MKISVVTPTLNAKEYLPECLESVRRSETPALSVEHVIVDGGSTDGTVEIAHQYGARVLTGKDKGIFDAINKGSFAATGDLVGFLGADDTALPGGLAKVAAAYSHNPGSVISGGVLWVGSDGDVIAPVSAPPQWLTAEMLVSLGWCCIWHMATFVPRELYHQLGGFNIAYRDAGDLDFFARALNNARFVRVPDAVSTYRRTAKNNSVVNRQRAATECQTIAAAHGTSSKVRQTAYRYLLKTWMNTMNPQWMLSKYIPNAAAR